MHSLSEILGVPLISLCGRVIEAPVSPRSASRSPSDGSGTSLHSPSASAASSSSDLCSTSAFGSYHRHPSIANPSALVQLEEDLLAREPLAVRIVAHHGVQLGRHHHVLALRIRLQKLAHQLLARPHRVHIRRVSEIDAQIQRLFEDRLAPLTYGMLASASRS